LISIDPLIFGAQPSAADLHTAMEKLFPYIEREMSRGARLHNITRHLLGLFRGSPGARAFRRHLATEAVKPSAGPEVLRQALAMILDTDIELAQTAA
jgi:tRNA-dihydrouridine synthase A